MKIAVLAVQGAFIEHIRIMENLGASTVELRQKADLNQPYDALIIPGGESTAMCKILQDLDMLATLQEQVRQGMPVFGTCAGMIMLAKDIANDELNNLATMDINVVRNAYGRQLGSFYANASFGDIENVPMTFIRAPYIESVGEGVEVLSTVDDKIVAAQQGNQLATSFHPELTEDISVHEYFLNMVKAYLAAA